MTRDDISDLVTKTVGQTDATSLALCNTFVQRAYEMVWNAELWRDTVTIDTTGSVSAGVNTYTMPAGFERVISLQLLSGGVPVGFLDPTTSTFILQTEPTALTTQGVPTKYEEFVHTDGSKKIRLFPLPNASYTLTMSGKRTCPTLSGSDSLQIRNVDNAVIALATSDMYTRLRQLGKAAEMAKKAGAFIEEAKAIEHQQSNQPRVAKTPTVTTNTFAELVDAVCAKCGNWSPDSVILARNFLKRRYRYIWDKYLWRDTITSATGVTISSVDSITTPPAIERVISVTANGKLLDPLDMMSVLQIEPTALAATDEPRYFQESNGFIRFMPVPNAVYAVTVVGKKPITNFSSDASTSAIRNIDNALIEYAASDLMQRLGNADGAKNGLEAANTELKAAIDLESEQAFKARTARNLTVSGNSLEEMAWAVCARTGQYSPESVVLIKELLRRNYQTVYDACNWSESTVMANVTTDGSEIILPVYFDRVISLRADVNLGQLSVVEPSLYFGIAPGIFEQTGTPIAFSYLTPVAVAILPPTREKLAIKSSSASDKSKVFVMGESAGGHLSETVVLNGTTEVNTVNDYDTPLTVAKTVTAGDVRIRAQTSDIVLETILAAERERKHMRLWVQPTPTTSQTCLVLGKRTIKPLVQDEDTPLLRDVGNILIAMTCADVFSKNGKDKASAEARMQAANALKALIDLETNQGAYSARVVPEVEYCYDEIGYDDWIVAKV